MSGPTMKLVQGNPLLERSASVFQFDDFNDGLDATNKWAKTVSSSVTIAAAAGIATFTTTTTANDEAYLAAAQKVLTPGQNHAAYLEAYLQFAEANTNQANVFFGIGSAFTTGAFVTSSGGLRTTGAFIGIYKKGGETNWRAHAQNAAGGNGPFDTLSTAASGLAGYQKLTIEIMPQYGSYAEITYRVDGLLLMDNSNPQQAIKHQLDLTSIAACQLGAMLRAGATATVAEVLNVDYLGGSIVR